jgi:hypothetical protein
MKASDIRPGQFAITRVSGTRKRVTILGYSEDKVNVVVRVQDTRNLVYRTPRQLSVATADLGHNRALRVVSSAPGQTIDAGDVVITTTLHRLG